MHVQTHVLAGWCLGNWLGLDKRGRTLAIAAGALADLDGLGILFGYEFYWKYHHVLCHNLAFGVAMAAGLAWFCSSRWKAFGAFLLIFHLHLLMDFFGSGEGWGIPYFWPLWERNFVNPYGWPFTSRQNLAAAGFFILWTVRLIFSRRRTFFETIMPGLDRQIVELAGGEKRKIGKWGEKGIDSTAE